MPRPESLNCDQISQLLREKYCILREYIAVEDFYPWLRSNNVFSKCDEEEIQNTCPTTKSRAGALLDKIMLKGPLGFKAFTEVLEYSQQYGHVYTILFDCEPRKPSKAWTDTVKVPLIPRRSSSLRAHRQILDFASSLADRAEIYKDKAIELEKLLESLQLEWEDKEKVLANAITDKEKGMESLKRKLDDQEQEITSLKTENEKLLEKNSELTTMKDSLKTEIDKIQERHRNQMSQTFPKQYPSSPSKKASLTEITGWFDNNRTEEPSVPDEVKMLREKVELLEKENKLMKNDMEFENLQLRQLLCNGDEEFAKYFEQEQKLQIDLNQALEKVRVAHTRQQQAERRVDCWSKKYEEEKRRYDFSQSKLLADVQDLKQELLKRHHCCGASVGDVICRTQLEALDEETGEDYDSGVIITVEYR